MLDNIEVRKLILKFPKLSNHLIEKDILLSEILEYIVGIFDKQKWSNNYYLCGGTSLSKCYKTTNRLSEDIDLSIYSYTKTVGKKIIKEISVLIDQMEKDNKIVIKSRGDLWNTNRTFLNCKFEYKNHEFSFDVKFVNFAVTSESIQRKNIYNVVEKHFKKELNSKAIVPVIDIHHIVAEKLLVFDKKYKNEKSGIGMDDEYITKRLFRHVYDIFMIFEKKLINLVDQDIFLINQIFIKISKEEKNFTTSLLEINLFQEDFFTLENKGVLKYILNSECYENIRIKDIINFYNQMCKKFKNTLDDK